MCNLVRKKYHSDVPSLAPCRISLPLAFNDSICADGVSQVKDPIGGPILDSVSSASAHHGEDVALLPVHAERLPLRLLTLRRLTLRISHPPPRRSAAAPAIAECFRRKLAGRGWRAWVHLDRGERFGALHHDHLEG